MSTFDDDAQTRPRKTLRPRDGTHADATPDKALRRIIAEPEFALGTLLDDEPALAYAMALTPGQLRKEYADAVVALDRAADRNGGMRKAIRRLTPYLIAFLLRGVVHDEVPRSNLAVVRGRFDVETASEQGERGGHLRACADHRNDAVILPVNPRHDSLTTLTAAETARLCGTHPGTVRRWAATLPGAYRDPDTNDWRLPVSAVLERVRKQEKSHAAA